MTQPLQSALQQAIRSALGCANDFNGDLHAMCQFYDVPEVPISGRLIAVAQKFDPSITDASSALNYFLQNPQNACGNLALDFVNSTTLDPRVTFTRASQATLFDSTGTLKYAKHNLLTYSDDFANAAWTKSNSSITSNTIVAPDGTLTGDKLVEDANTGKHLLQPLSSPSYTSGTTYTYSVFAKAAERTFLQLRVSASNQFSASFDLSVGTASQQSAGTTATVVPVGNGWYRCSITFTANATGTGASRIGVMQDATTQSYTGDGTSGIYIWGAQLNLANMEGGVTSSLDTYYPTTTAAYYAPRFDHDPTTGEALGLLIEEQRTNLCLQSEDFSTTWVNFNSAEEVNIIVAPDGTLTGDKLIPDTTSSAHTVQQVISVTSGTTYTFTVYAKAGEYYGAGLLFPTSGFGTNSVDVFDLSTGTVVTNASGNATITSVGNGWYRISSTRTASATASSTFQIRAYPATSSGNYAGDDYSGIYIWGAQFEAGAFPTSYIPTTSASVTRNADAASMTGTNFSSWYNAAEGTIYSEHQSVSAPNLRAYSISDGTNNNALQGVITTSGGSGLNFEIRQSGSTVAFVPSSASPVAGQFYKLAGAYKVNDVAASRDGGTVGTDTSVIIPVVDRLYIGAGGTGSNYPNGTIRKLAYYPQRLTNAQLQALTG